MAKVALVGYGSDGRGVGKTTQGYTYIVNDNVRTGDRIQPVATSSRGRKFVTTGVVNHSYKETSVKGQQATQQVQENPKFKGDTPTQAYTGKELGLERKGVSQPTYQQQVRGANLAMQKQKDPNTEFTARAQETFDSYSKQFMKGDK